MAWYRCGGSSAPSIVVDKLVSGQKIWDSDTSSAVLVPIPNLSNYQYIYVSVIEVNYANKTNYSSYYHNRGMWFKVSELTSNEIVCKIGYFWDSTNINIGISTSGIRCTQSYNNYNQFVDVIGSDSQLF